MLKIDPRSEKSVNKFFRETDRMFERRRKSRHTREMTNMEGHLMLVRGIKFPDSLSRADVEYLHDKYAEMTADMFEIIILRYIDGLTITDIATKLDCSERTISRRLIAAAKIVQS